MTYESTVQLKFDATYTPTYGSGSTVGVIDDFIPEEQILITAPAGDLNANQYFKLFEKFMLCVGMCPSSIRSGAMSLVFNDMVLEEEQRKVCKEYELTMDEDLEKKYQEYKERDAQWAKLNAHYEKNFGSEPKIKGDYTKDEKMTEYEQKLYDVIADWWDDVFVNNKDKNATIIDLVKSISEIDDWDKPIPEGVDPYNLTGRDPTQSVWKNGKRPSPDYYEILNGKMND